MPRKPVRHDDFFSKEILGARRFYLDMGSLREGPLTVAAGGWETCAPEYHMERQGFPYYGLEFVCSGRGTLVLSGVQHALSLGSVFCYGPGIAHRITNDPKETLRKYFVDFRGKPALQRLRRAGFEPGTCARVRNVPRLASLFEELVTSGTQAHADAQRGVVLALDLIFLALVQECVPADGLGVARDTFERCQGVLQSRFLRFRSVTEFAEASHVDPAYLCRLYKRFLGQSPYRRLVQLQMAWVAERLLEPGCLVREVAQELGMDPFQLSRTFRRVHGVSPKHFLRLRTG